LHAHVVHEPLERFLIQATVIKIAEKLDRTRCFIIEASEKELFNFRVADVSPSGRVKVILFNVCQRNRRGLIYAICRFVIGHFRPRGLDHAFLFPPP
jgi:hypothetical protein